MKKIYSLYEAKTHFSEIVRQVRELGTTVTVSYHGQPVAEIRPVEPVNQDPFSARVAELTTRGELIPGNGERLRLHAVATRPAALRRFLEERA